MERVYLWHPILVHFTVGLLTTSVGLYVLARLVNGEPWRDRIHVAAQLNLWLGALITALTVGVGMIAYGSAPRHAGDPQFLLSTHSKFAYATFTLFAALAAISAWRRQPTTVKPTWPFLAGLLVALAALTATAYLGGELVFSHGLGVEVQRP